MMNKKKKHNLQLYLHIPFCVRKCNYCDFLSGPATKETIEQYANAMKKEILSYKKEYENYEVSTIFLGGGTPSLLSARQMEGVFSTLFDTFQITKDAEISIEVNPGTVTKEKISVYKKIGINRLSIGLQSTNEKELRLLGRIHTMKDFLETYQMARECGFQNINVDLMSALPGQTVESWKETLQTITQLNPEHISAYSLIIEEGTPFYEKYKNQECQTEEDERKIYKETIKFLKEHNYNRYEISNYAKPGFECRHNKGYWERENYLGIGLGAASLIENQRFQHIMELEKYIHTINEERFEDIIVEQEMLTIGAQMEEFMFLGLRLTKGISIERFYLTFEKKIEEVYGGVIQELIQRDLLVKEGKNLCLTEYGIDISNYVMSKFLLS